MDRHITCRFFKIEPELEAVPPFEDACAAAFALGDEPHHRERQLKSITVRMERFGKSDQFFHGEAVRVQTENIPPEASPKGLTPLAIGGLGHAIAFRYHPALRVMAIQFDTRAVSVGHLMTYLRDIDSSYRYRYSTLVTEDAWGRYNDGQPRKFVIQLAAPQNLAEVEGPVGELTDALRTLGEIADAPMIRIEVSMGQRRRGHLNRNTITKAIRYFTSGGGSDEDVRKLSSTVSFEGDGGSQDIDFLNEKLKNKGVLDLPNDNAERHYRLRDRFLKDCFAEHFEYIARVYGAKS